MQIKPTNSPADDIPGEEIPFASVRIASTPDEIKEAQRLRYKVFYEEYKAVPSPAMEAEKRDFDAYDDIADHLIVINHKGHPQGEGQIVGTYRLLRQDIAAQRGGFYSSNEYNLDALYATGGSLLELGRSCVLAEYRTKPILNLLWRGIADYVSDHNIDLLFGCGSFPGTDIKALSEQLSYLNHFHKAPAEIRPIARSELFIDMNIVPKDQLDQRRLFNSLPPLIKGYLRAGALIGEGAVIDQQFNTTDVCIVVQTRLITDRYKKYYERKIQKPIGMSDASSSCFSDD